MALDQVTLNHLLWALDQQERWCQTSWSSGPILKIPKIPKNLNIRGYENSLTEMYVGFVGVKGRLKEALVITNPLKCQLYINNFFNIIFLFINRIEFMINTVVQKSGSRLKKRWLRSRLWQTKKSAPAISGSYHCSVYCIALNSLRKEYCHSKNNTKCPFYTKSMAKNAQQHGKREM